MASELQSSGPVHGLARNDAANIRDATVAATHPLAIGLPPPAVAVAAADSVATNGPTWLARFGYGVFGWIRNVLAGITALAVYDWWVATPGVHLTYPHHFMVHTIQPQLILAVLFTVVTAISVGVWAATLGVWVVSTGVKVASFATQKIVAGTIRVTWWINMALLCFAVFACTAYWAAPSPSMQLSHLAVLPHHAFAMLTRLVGNATQSVLTTMPSASTLDAIPLTQPTIQTWIAWVASKINSTPP